jgi:hypothetical protein
LRAIQTELAGLHFRRQSEAARVDSIEIVEAALSLSLMAVTAKTIGVVPAAEGLAARVACVPPSIAAVSTVADQRREQWPGRGLVDRVELAVLQILDPGQEPVAQQMAEAKHVICRAGGVGVVLDDAQIGLVGMMVSASWPTGSDMLPSESACDKGHYHIWPGRPWLRGTHARTAVFMASTMRRHEMDA